MARGAGLARTSMARKAPTGEPKLRQRKCALKDCRTPFAPRSMSHRACCPEHALTLVEVEKARALKREKQAGLAKLKTKRDYLKEAQVAFNSFIRLRDQLAGHACISSGRPLDWSGNAVDAGHYRSVGSAPHLRFNEDNCHAQSKHDNQWKSGNAVDYRLGLIARIGLARVEALEADQEPRKWTAEQLIAIRDEYRAKLRELKKSRGPG
jgi:hypothetical protein